jgi:ATP-binding protein involved in chromosome partitioning
MSKDQNKNSIKTQPLVGTQTLPGVKHTIAIASAKGGVGKSTVAVNLAVALQQSGQRVGILDLDIYGPSLTTLLNIHTQPLIKEQKLQPVEKYNLKAVSFGMFIEGETPVIWRGPLVAKLISQFFEDINWGQLDYLVIDLPPGTGDAQLTMVQKILISGVIMVTTPQQLALIDVQKGAEMFRHVNTSVLGIIENMSYFQCPHCGEKSYIFKGSGGQIESARLGVPLLGKIPLSADLTETSDQGKPELIAHPESEVSRIFREIAAKLIIILP